MPDDVFERRSRVRQSDMNGDCFGHTVQHRQDEAGRKPINGRVMEEGRAKNIGQGRSRCSSSHPNKNVGRSTRRRKRSISSSSSDTDSDQRNHGRYRSQSKGKKTQLSAKGVADWKKEIRPYRFNGKSCVETFITQFRICAGHNKWNEAEKTAQLKCSLIEDAGQLIWDSGRPDEITYDELIEKLRRRYGSLDQHEKYKAQLRTRRRGTGESLARVYQDIRGLMSRAYPGQATTDMGEQMARDHFLLASNDKSLELTIRERFPNTLDEAFKQAVQLEALLDTVDANHGRDEKRSHGRGYKDEGLNRRVAHLEQKATGSAEIAVNASQGEVAELRHQINELSKELGRVKASQPQIIQHPGPPQVQASLNNQRMPASEQEDSWKISGQPLQHRENRGRCYNCGGVDHFIRNCPQPRSNRETAISAPPEQAEANRSTTSGEVEHGRRTYVRIRINGVMRKALLDTGSDVTLLPSFAVERLHLQKCSTKLKAANGTSIRIRGTTAVDVQMGEHEFKITGLVTDHVAEVMLGFDCMREHNAIWDFKNDRITWDGTSHELCSKNGQTWCRRVVLQTDCVVPPRSEVNLQTKVIFNDLTGPRLDVEPPWITDARTLDCGLRVSRTILPKGNVNIPVRVVNTQSNPITLKRGTIISELEPVELLESLVEEAQDEDRDNTVLCEMVSRVDPSVTTADRQRLKALLEKYTSVFSRGENDLGRTDVVTHNIDTGDNKPVRQSLRRHPPLHQVAIRQQIRDMLTQGTIEPTKSPWASNIVLVKKRTTACGVV